nr:chromosome segregation protein SMC [Pseudomonadales bacterium]
MRLQAIKLAGFKSFVDPTTVPFPSNLCAVVGPNGCGKSNIIDAVRWVMGESSAKTLRGESMADVIFNGSNARKPVGQASVELLFDNAEGRLTGEYAAYSEVSVKRRVTRDGQSIYFLNGQKCRRKDITDLFLGTGLGPRSYSIIEQGIISDLIEAKPEELRSYLEEAAGISKYKERRRETNHRIRHTRDNLDRLKDLREELERQLTHLERQAKAAERYRELKKEERELKAGLFGLRCRALSTAIKSQDDAINRLTIEQDARVAQQRRIDAEVESKRTELTDLSDQLNEVQKLYYDHGTEIARIEDSIQFQNERTRQLNADLDQVMSNLTKVQNDLKADEQQIDYLRVSLAETQPRKDEIAAVEHRSGEQLFAAEQAMQSWQAKWDEFNQAAAESRQKGEVEQSRIQHFEEAIERANARIQSLDEHLARLAAETSGEEIGSLEQMLATQEQQLERIDAELSRFSKAIERQRENNKQTTQTLDQKRSDLQSLSGRFASLEALQHAALGQQDDVEVDWLERHGLAGQHRLGERIRVEDGWPAAVETVLGDHLQAVCVDGIDAVSALLGDFSKGHLSFIAGAESAATSVAAGSLRSGDALADKVSGDAAVAGLLKGILTAPNLVSAMAMRGSLSSGESIVTPDGIWLGQNWLRVNKDKDAEAGVLNRQQELESLEFRISQIAHAVEQLSDELESGMASLHQAETERDAQQKRLAEKQRSFGETRAQLSAKKIQAEQVKTDTDRVRDEVSATQTQRQADEVALRASRSALEAALDAMESDTQLRQTLSRRRDAITLQLEEARSKAKTDSDAAHQLALRIQSLNSQIASSEQAMARLAEQQEILVNRKNSLEDSIRGTEEPQSQLRTELEQQLAKRLEVESALMEVRRKSETVEHAIREQEQHRTGIEEQIDAVRSNLEKDRLERGTLEVRQSTIKEQLQEENQVLEDVLNRLPEDAGEEEWEQNLTRMGNRIQRLGAINLAAIDEYKVQSERKQYLDAQNEDLEKALAILENAIR